MNEKHGDLDQYFQIYMKNIRILENKKLFLIYLLIMQKIYLLKKKNRLQILSLIHLEYITYGF